MTQPQAKIHHRTAVRGHFVMQPGKSLAQSLELRTDSHVDEVALATAIAFVDEQLAFWSMTQFHDIAPDMIAGHRMVFAAMRRWPRV